MQQLRISFSDEVLSDLDTLAADHRLDRRFMLAHLITQAKLHGLPGPAVHYSVNKPLKPVATPKPAGRPKKLKELVYPVLDGQAFTRRAGPLDDNYRPTRSSGPWLAWAQVLDPHPMGDRWLRIENPHADRQERIEYGQPATDEQQVRLDAGEGEAYRDDTHTFNQWTMPFVPDAIYTEWGDIYRRNPGSAENPHYIQSGLSFEAAHERPNYEGWVPYTVLQKMANKWVPYDCDNPVHFEAEQAQIATT